MKQHARSRVLSGRAERLPECPRKALIRTHAQPVRLSGLLNVRAKRPSGISSTSQKMLLTNPVVSPESQKAAKQWCQLSFPRCVRQDDDKMQIRRLERLQEGIKRAQDRN